MKTTTRDTNERAVTFNHQKRVIGESVRDAETPYYSQSFRNEDETRRLDVANLRDDVSEQNLMRVEQFISGTDFKQEALVMVQTEVPSSEYELEFDFFNRVGETTQIIVHLGGSDSKDSESAISTILVKTPSKYTDEVEVTIVDVGGAYTNDPLHTVTTFSPPNETLFESLNVGPSNDPLSAKLDVPGGALLTNEEIASQFTPGDSSYGDFISETNFNGSYVMALQATMPNSGYYMFPQMVETGESEVRAHVRQQNFGGGLNAEFAHLLLTRIPDTSPPERGTAILRTYDLDETVLDVQEIKVSSESNNWPSSG